MTTRKKCSSTMTKGQCAKEHHCQWIVGKGCQAKKNPQQTQQPQIENTPTNLLPEDVILKYIKKFHPLYILSDGYRNVSNSFVFHCAKHILRKKNNFVVVSDIKSGFENAEYPEVTEHFNSACDRSIKFPTDNEYIPAFQKHINNIFGKVLSEEASRALFEGLIYIHLELIDCTHPKYEKRIKQLFKKWVKTKKDNDYYNEYNGYKYYDNNYRVPNDDDEASWIVSTLNDGILTDADLKSGIVSDEELHKLGKVIYNRRKLF